MYLSACSKDKYFTTNTPFMIFQASLLLFLSMSLHVICGTHPILCCSTWEGNKHAVLLNNLDSKWADQHWMAPSISNFSWTMQEISASHRENRRTRDPNLGIAPYPLALQGQPPHALNPLDHVYDNRLLIPSLIPREDFKDIFGFAAEEFYLIRQGELV